MRSSARFGNHCSTLKVPDVVMKYSCSASGNLDKSSDFEHDLTTVRSLPVTFAALEMKNRDMTVLPSLSFCRGNLSNRIIQSAR